MDQSRHQRRAFARVRERFGDLIRLVRAADRPQVIQNILARVFTAKPGAVPQRIALPLKHLRLQELVDRGFNTPEFMVCLKGELDIFLVYQFLCKHGKISLRTFREEHFSDPTPKLPVEYDRDEWSVIRNFCEQQNRDHHLLINQALPLSRSLYAGNIILPDADSYVVSFFEGYGTPRDVDDQVSRLKVHKRRFTDPPPQIPNDIIALALELQGFRPKLRPLTVEFSVYPDPVGLCKRRAVVWEWRGGAEQDLATALPRLIEGAEQYDMNVHLERRRTKGAS